jgi:hypothetical protein
MKKEGTDPTPKNEREKRRREKKGQDWFMKGNDANEEIRGRKEGAPRNRTASPTASLSVISSTPGSRLPRAPRRLLMNVTGRG